MKRSAVFLLPVLVLACGESAEELSTTQDSTRVRATNDRRPVTDVADRACVNDTDLRSCPSDFSCEEHGSLCCFDERNCNGVCIDCAPPPDEFPICPPQEQWCDDGVGQCCRLLERPTADANRPDSTDADRRPDEEPPVVCYSCAPTCEGPNPAANTCTSDRECNPARGSFCEQSPLAVCLPSQCECEQRSGQWLCTDDCAGTCVQHCGGFAGWECPRGSVCIYDDADRGVQDAVGTCVRQPDASTVDGG